MVRNIVFVCAAIAGFGMTFERPNNLAEARRRCCYQRYQYSGNCCQTGYQTYAYQNQSTNQCGQTYNQGTQYQSYSQGGEATVPPPAPAPAPDNRSTYYRNGTQDASRNGATVPQPAPANRPTAPTPAERRTFDNNAVTPSPNNAGERIPSNERPAAPAPNVPE